MMLKLTDSTDTDPEVGYREIAESLFATSHRAVRIVMSFASRAFGLAVVSLFFAAAPASAQTPLRIVVPFPPGGSQDVMARYLANQLGLRLGVPVLVDNKAGAGGVIGADAVAKAAPDGNTVLLASPGPISIAPHLNPKLPYDPRRDFVSVSMLVDAPHTIVVRAQSPYATMADLLKDAKARPGRVTFASTGTGSVSHLLGELFGQVTGVSLLHVPYRGAAPAVADLLGGQVDMIVTAAASVTPMVDDRKVRILGSFSSARIPDLRGGVPTMLEATGMRGLDVPVWVGLMAPAKTPPAILEKLATEVTVVCHLPETQERFKSLGTSSVCGGPKDLSKVVAEDLQRWGKVIQLGNIKPTSE